MRLTRLQIRNFKGLKELDVALKEEGTDEPRHLTMLLGDNGSGKTTVLQAIALTLSLASRKIDEPADLASLWPGFLAERVSSLGSTRVELDVVFDTEELDKTAELYGLWSQQARPEIVRALPPPDGLRRVTLIYEDGALRCAEGPRGLSQFLGRFFIRYLSKTHRALEQLSPLVGDVFWFHQLRDIFAVEQLRGYLKDWWGYRASPRGPGYTDFLTPLENHLAQIFPGIRFAGTSPRPEAIGGSYVWLERSGQTYDIAEMSSGEQAIFPLLYDFVRLRIARAVVLIDELELHLHPPQQQALLAALRRLGPDCQFIITSHSSHLEAVVPDEEEIRLQGGRRCL